LEAMLEGAKERRGEERRGGSEEEVGLRRPVELDDKKEMMPWSVRTVSDGGEAMWETMGSLF